MPLKSDHSTSTKDFLTTTEKQLGKTNMADLKGNKQSVKSPTMPNEDDTKGNKQPTKNPNILKEATSSTKPKSQKTLKEERIHQQEKTKTYQQKEMPQIEAC